MFYPDCPQGNQLGSTIDDQLRANFQALRNLEAGTSFPTNPVANMLCVRTDQGTAGKLYVRNATNTAWDLVIDLAQLPENHRTAAAIDHPDSSIPAAKLATDAVETDKIKDGAVTAAKLAAGAIPAFGAWTSKDVNTVYQAATDGFVVGAVINTYGAVREADLYTDGSNPPTTKRMNIELNANKSRNFCCPVKKDDYWKMDAESSIISGFWWVPFS